MFYLHDRPTGPFISLSCLLSNPPSELVIQILFRWRHHASYAFAALQSLCVSPVFLPPFLLLRAPLYLFRFNSRCLFFALLFHALFLVRLVHALVTCTGGNILDWLEDLLVPFGVLLGTQWFVVGRSGCI